MAVKVRDTTNQTRILPEVAEVGQRIDLKVGDEATRAKGVEGQLRTDVDAASSAAGAAQSTADTAKSTAEAAQSAAGTAQSKAEAAQSAASAADTKAGQAQTAASTAQSAAEAADTKATDAQTRVTTVEGKIPAQASSSNQLADKNFVNSSIEQSAANRVTYDQAGNPFPTRAALTGASTFYFNGVAYTPNAHDYALVVADEGAPAPFTGGQTRFEWSGSAWVYAYGINDKPFTSDERAAIESGITSEKVTQIDTLTTAVSDLQDTVGDLEANSTLIEYYELKEGDWTSGSQGS